MSIQGILSKVKNDSIKVSGISFDTRTLKKNNIFFAIPGSNDDGLKYVDLAIDKGASAIVVPYSSKKFLKKKFQFIK
jgi:UDP-N-acetylmuramyl pentapeptide synthase